MNEWSLEPVFGWLAVLPLALVMLAGLWLTLSIQGLSKLQRAVLTALRLIAAALLMLGWLRPGLIRSVERETESVIAVLFDDSESMTMPSGSGELSRRDVSRNAWMTIEKEAARDFGKTRFVPFFFDRTLHPSVTSATTATSGPSPTTSRFAEKPTGKATDLGAALAELQRTQQEPPLRGAILVSDGVQTVIPATTDPTLVAKQMSQLDQPVIVLGVGPRSESSRMRDLAVEGVPEQLTAFEKNRLSVPAVVRARGLQNTPITLKMTLRSSGRPDIALKPTELNAATADQVLPVVLEIEAPQSGEYLLEVTAQSEAREQVLTNNTSISFLTVRAGGSRVLYIEGQPRHEFTFLKRSINSSLDFQVEYLWIQELTRSSWPRNLSAEYDFNQFDAFILGDLDSSALSKESWEAIRRRVDFGAGLLILGGFHSYDAGGYGNSPMSPVFPVVLSGGAKQKFGSPPDPAFHISSPIKFLPAENAPHPITRLAPEPENTEIWKSLKPLRSVNKIKPKVAPGVQTIAEGPDHQPLLITGEFGRGRVLAFAGDSTFQWWMQGQQIRHKQFWRQCMLWMLGRDSLQEGFRLILDRRRLMLDEEENVLVEWVGGSQNKPMPENITFELSRDGKSIVQLDSLGAGENKRRVPLKNLHEAGLYRLQLKAVGSDNTMYSTDVAFVVRDESRELQNPLADWQQLQNIAAAAEPAGGRLITIDDIPDTMKWLRERQAESRVTTVEKRRLGDGTWDAWLYFISFCGIMTFEWMLRKRWQLP
ncbi:MAG: hypothetical protein U0892_09260 [Pirellulales bacterium]